MIIDAIIFYNELDVLDVRLHELDSIVDKFVLVEALECHGSANLKSAVLAENWQSIKPFEHKLKYMVLPRLEPQHHGRDDSWPRENFHRNALMQVIEEVSRSASDIVMISDCDEIPRASAVTQNIRQLEERMLAFSQDLFYYNPCNYMGPWNGTVGGTLSALRSSGPQAWRQRRDDLARIVNGGWHFSYFGGRDRIINKMGNFAHASEDSCRLAKHWLESGDTKPEDLAAGRDLYRRDGCDRKELRSIDDSRLPRYMGALR